MTVTTRTVLDVAPLFQYRRAVVFARQALAYYDGSATDNLRAWLVDLLGRLDAPDWRQTVTLDEVERLSSLRRKGDWLPDEDAECVATGDEARLWTVSLPDTKRVV